MKALLGRGQNRKPNVPGHIWFSVKFMSRAGRLFKEAWCTDDKQSTT